MGRDLIIESCEMSGRRAGLAARPFAFDAMTPDLSVIIPTLNEAECLPLLLDDLAAQTGVSLEVLVSDGNSIDGTREIARATLARLDLAGEVLVGEPGRGRQLNRGAAHARGEWLLFLHADSRFLSVTALADGLACLRRERNLRLAGRFALRFELPDGNRDFGYYLCQIKARLGLAGTIHGDQGFLLPGWFFAELGGFREDLPVMEDTLLAEKIRSTGLWYLLPAVITTSPRRFQAEGFAVRQTINALLMNFAMIGWDEPIRRAPDAYRAQDRARPLTLAPLARLIDDCLRELPLRERVRIWYHTGRYVGSNAWQLMVRCRARRAFAAGCPVEAVSLQPVKRCVRVCQLFTNHPPGYLAAAMLTWLWFRTRRRTLRQGA
jgi:rSAM/selenodomain-associated transferase 2